MKPSTSRAILVTGGAGYIGAHTSKALHARGYVPVVFDNLSSGFREAVRWGPLIHGDIRDVGALVEAMTRFEIQAVIHFAGLIEVGRSSLRPDLFWDVNVRGTAQVIAAMQTAGVRRLVFSSSAAVYGAGDTTALGSLVEDAATVPTSCYGETKLAGERLIAAHCHAFGLSAFALRYFNASGADPSGRIGEAHDPETHLIPLAIESALGGRTLTVFGADFPTPDGTCVRDYVHVTDLAAAHVAALEAHLPPGGFEACNVGVGEGHSVRQVLAAVERAVGRRVPHEVGPRRRGDPAALVADATRAFGLLGWRAEHQGLEAIVHDALRWERQPAYGIGRRAAQDLSHAEAAE